MGMNGMLTTRAEFKRLYREALADTSPATIIPVQSKRLHQATFTMGLLRELPALFTVFVASASALQGEHEGAGLALAVAELITGAAVLFFIAVEARHLFTRHEGHVDSASHAPPRVDKSNLAAAALGYVEAWHRTHVTGHFKLLSPQIVGASVSLFLALRRPRPVSERRQRRRPHVSISPNGIRYLGGPLRIWTAPWADVAAVEHTHGEIAIRLHDGRRHVLRADDHLDGEGILDATRAAIASHAPHVMVPTVTPTSDDRHTSIQE